MGFTLVFMFSVHNVSGKMVSGAFCTRNTYCFQLLISIPTTYEGKFEVHVRLNHYHVVSRAIHGWSKLQLCTLFFWWKLQLCTHSSSSRHLVLISTYVKYWRTSKKINLYVACDFSLTCWENHNSHF